MSLCIEERLDELHQWRPLDRFGSEIHAEKIEDKPEESDLTAVELGTTFRIPKIVLLNISD